MKIIFVTAYYLPSIGGVQNYVNNLVQGLRADHELIIVTTCVKGLAKYEKSNGVTIYRLPVSFKLSNTPINPLWYWRFKRIFKKENPDIINIHAPVPFMADLALLAAKNNFKTVFTYHSGSMVKNRTFVDYILRAYQKIILPHILSWATQLAAVHPDFVRGVVGSKKTVHYLPPGVDINIFKPQATVKQFDVCFAARIEKSSDWKGLDVLLQATKIVLQRQPDFKLLVVGGGDALESFKLQTKDLGIAGSVTFVGPCAQVDLAKFYNLARIFALPSKTDAESFGMTLAEAMACGLPSIASNIGGVPNLIQTNQNGILVNPGDAAKLAEEICKLLHDKANIKRLGKAGRLTVNNNFSIARQISKTLHIFTATQKRLSKQRFKLVQISAHYPPFLGGMEQRIQELSQKLANAGNEVTVLTSDQKNYQHTEHPQNGLTVKFLKSWEIAHTAIIPKLWKELLLMPNDSIVQVHIAHAFLPEVTSLICRLRRIPYIAHIRTDVTASGWLGKVLLPGYKRIFLSRVLKKAAHIIVLTEDHKALMHNKYRLPLKNISVIPNATEIDQIGATAKTSNKEVSLLFVGRLEVVKNLPLLLAGFKKARLEFPNKKLQLKIVGDGQLGKKLHSLVTKMDLGSSVEFCGALYGQELRQAYADADIFLLTSASESFGTVLIEAMACGLPIIATSIDAVRNIVIDGKNGILVEQNAESLASAITELASNHSRRQEISRFNLQAVKKYNWDSILDKFQIVYNKALRPVNQTAKSLWLMPILFLAVALSLARINPLGITFSLWIFILIPAFGYLILSSLKINKKFSVGDFLPIIIGLCLIGLIVIGLILNTGGLIFNIKTLTAPNIIISFALVFLLLLKKHFERGISTLPKIQLANSHVAKVWILLPIVFPVLAYIGATFLNNGLGNFWAISTILVIIGYCFLSALLFKSRSETAYLILIFCSALALLLSFSLRSNYLLGFDINQEFRIFEVIMANNIWQPHFFVDNTYNACLSIGLLPRVLAAFIPMSDINIFKFVLQFVAAVVPLTVFNIARKQLSGNADLAAVAALLFTFQTQFMFQLPALVRQQAAFLMFGLIIQLMVGAAKGDKQRVLRLVIVFGVGMVLSHYSSSYIALGILTIAFLTQILFKKIRPSEPKLFFGWMLMPIIAILFATVLWYGLVVGSTGNVFAKLMTSSSQQSVATNYFKSFYNAILGTEDFVYSQKSIDNLAANRKNISKDQSYPNSNSTDQMPKPYYAPKIDKPSGWSRVAMIMFGSVIPLLIKLSLLAGVLYGFVLWLAKKRTLEETSLMLAACLALVSFLALPGLSTEYNFERLYQQVLIILAGPLILFAAWILSKIKIRNVGLSRQSIACLTLVIALAYFLNTSGVVKDSNINLANSGAGFEKFYVNDDEFRALAWLNNSSGKSSINFDRYSVLRAQAYTSINSKRMTEGLLPSDIGINNFVYVSKVNLSKKIVYDTYQKKLIMYDLPLNFLNYNKNLIYSNNSTRIYR